jgi:hypothetical protein
VKSTAERTAGHYGNPNPIAGCGVSGWYQAFVYSQEHCLNNHGVTPFFIYSNPGVLLETAEHQFQITVEFENFTLANMSNSAAAGVFAQFHTGNLSLSYTGCSTYGTRIFPWTAAASMCE